MSLRPTLFAFGCLGATLFTGLTPTHAALITGWNFNADQSAPGTDTITAAPAPSTGNGTAASLGFNGTTYNGTASTENSDVFTTTAAADQGSSDPATAASNVIWRLRGNNGWSSNAPTGSQGAQFSLATTGFTAIQLQFDWSTTTQGEGKLQVQYTTNGTTFVNAPAGMYSAASYVSTQAGVTNTNPTMVLTNTTSANTVNGAYLLSGGQGWTNQITLNLAGIAAANNNPNFAVRFVSASTGADDTSSGSATTASGPLNNTSGNWRFDEVNVSGTAASVPEPGTFALLGLGLAGAGVLARRRRTV